jgi:Protein of unknown function (DUF2917)
MILDMKRMVIEMQRRGIAPLNAGVGTCIECLRATIWITEHRSKDDIVLEAGESYVISREGLAVVQALQEALVGFRAPEARIPEAGLGTLIERLRAGWWVRAAGVRSTTIAAPRTA